MLIVIMVLIEGEMRWWSSDNCHVLERLFGLFELMVECVTYESTCYTR